MAPAVVRNIKCTAPAEEAPASSPIAPAARSCAPSRSRSPSAASDVPNLSEMFSCGPFAVEALISAVRFTVPSELRDKRCAMPALVASASSPTAPAARSCAPSRSRSPSAASDVPNLSEMFSCGPFAVEALISAVRFTVPSELRYSRWTAPAEEAPASSPFAPTAMSAFPSPSRSPTAARDRPKESPLASRGPLAVEALISTVRFTVPSELRYSRWTAPAEEAPASSPFAPTAMSAIPSPSRSPSAASDVPNRSELCSCGPFEVDASISETERGYALLRASASSPPKPNSNACGPGVFIRTVSVAAPRPSYPAKTSTPSSDAGDTLCPAASRSPRNDTSPVGSVPMVVPSAPDTVRSCVSHATKRTVHRPPTSGYDCWFRTDMPSALTGATHMKSAATQSAGKRRPPPPRAPRQRPRIIGGAANTCVLYKTVVCPSQTVRM